MPLAPLLTAAAFLLAPSTSAIHLEAENAQLVGPTIATSRAGYTGTGYVTGFTHDGDKIVFQVTSPGGIYEVKVRYSSPGGEKGYGLTINDAHYNNMLAKTDEGFAVADAGKVELKPGKNTVAVEKGWGYYDIDALDLLPAGAPVRPLKPPKTLVDKKATAKTRALMSFLIDQYGKYTLSGQYNQQDTDYLQATTGQSPAIFGGDFIDYSPSRVAFGTIPKDYTEKIIAASRAGHIITMVWHWNAPTDLINKTFKNEKGEEVNDLWYFGFYTRASTFDLAKAIADPNSSDYQLILRDIDTIAVQMKKLADADVPVLWRPLHEAEGGWFWWGAKGPQPYIKLYRLMYDRLTNYHQLHNLIWVHNCINPAWYPGDDVVDIESIDAYPTDPTDPQSSTWDALQKRFNGKKLLAISEFGGVPDAAKLQHFGAYWAYFVTWPGFLDRYKPQPEVLSALYNSSALKNLKSIPKSLTAVSSSSP